MSTEAKRVLSISVCSHSTLTLVAVVPTAPTSGLTKTPEPLIGFVRNE